MPAITTTTYFYIESPDCPTEKEKYMSPRILAALFRFIIDTGAAWIPIRKWSEMEFFFFLEKALNLSH